MPETQSPLLIVGASARAAAFSAQRAGLDISCADLFADADLDETGAVRLPDEEYPYGLLTIIKEHDGPWLYTGALENYPDLIAEAERAGDLWGNPAPVLGCVRDPFLLMEFADEAGLHAPRCRHELPEDGDWLRKPFRSGCGTGISFTAQGYESCIGCYFQEYLQGIPCSSIYVGFEDGCLLLGATRQFIGEGALNVDGFRYCGSIGPLPVTPDQFADLERMGNLLASEFKLRGLFGVDCIHCPETGRFWMLEINPRYTASVEVLERASGLRAMRYHGAAFRCDEFGSEEFHGGGIETSPNPGKTVAKAILFSDRDFKFPDVLRPQSRQDADAPRDLSQWPHVADIPHTGTSIRSGHPVMTIFAEDESADECERKLWRSVEEWKRKLWAADGP